MESRRVFFVAHVSMPAGPQFRCDWMCREKIIGDHPNP